MVGASKEAPLPAVRLQRAASTHTCWMMRLCCPWRSPWHCAR